MAKSTPEEAAIVRELILGMRKMAEERGMDVLTARAVFAAGIEQTYPEMPEKGIEAIITVAFGEIGDVE